MPETSLRRKTADGNLRLTNLKREVIMDEKNITNAAENAAENSQETPAEPAKTFTQSELDEIVRERLDRERKKYPDKKQLEEFKAWQDSRKTAEELAAEKVTAAENARAEAEKILAMREAKIAALARGVSPDSADDVIALAMSKVSDDMPIEKAIEAVIAKYPAFAGGEKSAAPITTGVSFGGNAPQISGVEAAFLAKNPGIKI